MIQEPWEICPTEERLQAYAQKRLEGKYNEWTYRHLKFCGKCLRYLAKVSEIPGPDEIIHSGGIGRMLRRWMNRIFRRK